MRAGRFYGAGISLACADERRNRDENMRSIARSVPHSARDAGAPAQPDHGSDLREARRTHAASAGTDPGAIAAGRAAEVETWRVPAGDAATEDPLLGCLIILGQLLERPISPQALKAGLPLAEGRLTPQLAVRAAERAGLSARLARQSLERISELTLPCVLLLDDRSACVLVDTRS